MTDLRLIVGLGNPGKSYEYTRHNIGFLVVAALAVRFDLKMKGNSWDKSETAQGFIDDKECCLLRPLNYMNNSGVSVQKTLFKKNIDLNNTLIVADDFNLDFGQLRLRSSGSAGGHNGLRSVIDHVGSQDFPRLRVGIGSPPNKETITDFVLEKFSLQERKKLDTLIQDAVECCVAWVKGNADQVMSQFNRKKNT